MDICTVSVIITTRNEEINIRNCLDSIKRQRYPQEQIEIILVDNNSADGTKNIASEYTDKLYDCGPERSAQRNLGVKQAKGKYIFYLDADMILSDDAISRCVEKTENEKLVALYITERIVGKGFWVKVRDFERSFYEGTCIDCVRFVRRDKFLLAGGFDEALTGPEDWDFDRRIKETGQVKLINDIGLYHNEGAFNLYKYLGKKIYYSRSFMDYKKKWGRNDPLIKKQLGFLYRYFGVFLENGKFKKLIRHPHLAIFMYYQRFLVGVVYLLSQYSKGNRYGFSD